MIEPWGRYRPGPISRLAIQGMQAHIFVGAVRKAMRRGITRSTPVIDLQIDGVKLRCHLGDNLTESALIEHHHASDRVGMEMVIGQLAHGDIFVDVGANCGLFSTFAAMRVGSAGRVISIEPLPTMLERLRFNLKANGLTNVDVFAVAIDEAAGETSIRISESNYGESSICGGEGPSLVVPTCSLLDVIKLADVGRIDVLKIDIEGHEDRALEPFIRNAPRSLWPRLICIEIAHRAKWRSDCLATLVAAGYEEAWSNGFDAALRLSQATPP